MKSVCVCVCSKCSLKFMSSCCVWCTMTCFESGSAWLMFCYFLPFVVFVLIFDCSSSHLSLSLRLQRQDGEDLAVKGVEEEVRTAGTAVPLSAIFPTTWATDLWPARFYHRNVTLKSQFPRRSECLFFSFFVTRQHDKAEVKYVVKRKSICLSDFFYCQFESAIQMWCYLEKRNSIVPGCVCASGKKGFSPDMKTTAAWCQINEKVSFCSFKQWAGPAQRHVYSCICCLKIKTQPEFKKTPEGR